MVLLLSNLPKVGAALAFGLIATGIAVSESQTWDAPRPPLLPPQVDQMGPPMPESAMSPDATAESPGAPTVPVNLADIESDPRATGLPPTSGRAPESALAPPARPLNPAAPDVVEQAEVPTPVRTIDLPRRDDDLDELGRPTEVSDQYEVANLPTPDASGSPEDAPAVAEQELIAPIPAAAYRRPITSYLDRNDFLQPQPAPVNMEPVTPRRVGAYDEPYVVGVYDEPYVVGAYDEPYVEDDTWPRRLDQAFSVRGQNRVVAPNSTFNMFEGDWVEVREGGTRRVVAQ